MFRNDVYFELKPVLPKLMRRATRRLFARMKRARARKRWPILPGSEEPPAGWCGWPEKKRFALVLTHDIEGPSGLSKCRQLMECEMKLGFRSSFNFVPEGDYEVPKELREELTAKGFEVGVHDLHHDGKLYRSRGHFCRNAQRINHYLKEWGAVGFRSGFMLHNLEWAHELDLLYEASTFDTDPFEPQPDGLGTIFPLWVPRPNGAGRNHDTSVASDNGGYVELPYTLTQDSTLFLLLQERGPDIWLEKVDWIAAQGGMVLADTHPDYMSFERKNGNSDWEYPIEFYVRLLEHIKSKYRGAYWPALPREMAQFWTESVGG